MMEKVHSRCSVNTPLSFSCSWCLRKKAKQLQNCFFPFISFTCSISYPKSLQILCVPFLCENLNKQLGKWHFQYSEVKLWFLTVFWRTATLVHRGTEFLEGVGQRYYFRRNSQYDQHLYISTYFSTNSLGRRNMEKAWASSTSSVEPFKKKTF